MSRQRIAMLLIAVLMLSVVLCACSRESKWTNHEIAVVSGESLQLELEAIPEGKTATDYKWDCTKGLSVDQNGLVHTGEPGNYNAWAELSYQGSKYHEEFRIYVQVPLGPDDLSFDQEQIILWMNEKEPEAGRFLTVEVAAALPDGQGFMWNCSDETVVTLERTAYMPPNKTGIYAKGNGHAVVTVLYGGVEAVCPVAVLDPDEEGSYRWLIEQGEYHLAFDELKGRFTDYGGGYHWQETAPAALREAYASPLHFISELFRGHMNEIDARSWHDLWRLGILPTNELAEALSRLPLISELQETVVDDTLTAASHNGLGGYCVVDAEQYASFGTQPAGKAAVLWTTEESFRQYAPRLSPFNEDAADTLDCELTASLPEEFVPAYPEEITTLIAFSVSGEGELGDIQYSNADTGFLLGELTLINPRVTCRVLRLIDGVWTEVYHAGYIDGTMPKSGELHQSRVILGNLPTGSGFMTLYADAVEHLSD